jgi:hypothetical protein
MTALAPDERVNRGWDCSRGFRAGSSRVQSLWRVRGRGALSLRLRAQTLSRSGRGWVASAAAQPATGRAKTAPATPVRISQAPENSTSPGTGEVASLSEPERALSRGAQDDVIAGRIDRVMEIEPAPRTHRWPA